MQAEFKKIDVIASCEAAIADENLNQHYKDQAASMKIMADCCVGQNVDLNLDSFTTILPYWTTG